MGRVKIEPAKKPLFVADVPVRITDLNYGGHVGNDALLGILHEARVQFLRHFGFSESDVAGAGIIMTDATIVYAAQIAYGERLAVEVGLTEVRGSGADLSYLVLSGGREVARAITGIAFYDYASRRIARAPSAFRALLEAPPAAGS